jgi:hypothetical protein
MALAVSHQGAYIYVATIKNTKTIGSCAHGRVVETNLDGRAEAAALTQTVSSNCASIYGSPSLDRSSS